MANRGSARRYGYLSAQYINGIYIPCGLLLVGTAITKSEWLPYAVVVAVLLGTWKAYNNGVCVPEPNPYLTALSCHIMLMALAT
jgi:cytochrome-b5 reductase